MSGRLSLGAAAEQELAFICGNPELLRSALARADVLSETAVLQMAAHIAKPDAARGLYLAALALGPLQARQRERLVELHRLIQVSLERHDPLKSGLGVIESRRQATRALCEDPALRRWIEVASPAHVVAATPPDLLRQVGLMSRARLRKRFQVEVEVEAIGDRWRVEVAAPDRRGLLARTTGVLFSAGMDVELALAVVADGIALQSFLLSGPRPPTAPDLEQAFSSAMRHRVSFRPLPDAEIRFDDEGSPWATLCEVTAPDRSGVLHSVASAIAVSHGNVRSAWVASESGRAVDRFELVSGDGAKLTGDQQALISRRIVHGVTESRPKTFWPNLVRSRVSRA